MTLDMAIWGAMGQKSIRLAAFYVQKIGV